MSEENIRLVQDYERSHGGFIYKTSRHSVVVGQYRRGAPTSLIRVHANTDDPILGKYFERLQDEVVEPHIIQGENSLSTKRTSVRGNFRTGPILRIADELGLFEYLERPEVRARLFPTYPEFRIARTDDRVKHTRQTGRTLGYTLDENGNCRFTFRWTMDGDHGGVRSRGYSSHDAADRDKAGDTLEPQVNMRKFHPTTGEPIDDKGLPIPDRAPGHWRAVMVTLPLVLPVRELQAGETTFPVQTSPYSELMNSQERAAAGFP